MASVALGLICIAMGAMTLQAGSDSFTPKLHAYRRMFFPEIQTHIHENVTVEQAFEWIVQGYGITLVIAGASLLLRFDRCGSFLMLLAALFKVAMLDNPMLKTYLRPIELSENYFSLDSLTRDLGLVSAAFMWLNRPRICENQKVQLLNGGQVS